MVEEAGSAVNKGSSVLLVGIRTFRREMRRPRRQRDDVEEQNDASCEEEDKDIRGSPFQLVVRMVKDIPPFQLPPCRGVYVDEGAFAGSEWGGIHTGAGPSNKATRDSRRNSCTGDIPSLDEMDSEGERWVEVEVRV